MNFNRNNFKNIIIASIFLVVLIGPNFALAVTVEELQVQIKALMEEIKRLQEQLSRLQVQPSKWCHNFNVNLRYGDTGNEVYALHIALEKEGFTIPDSEKKDVAYDIAYFGDHTASAVVGFQEKYKEEVLTPWGLKRGTGYVGPTTRNKLNKLYGCGVVSPPESEGVPLPEICTDSDGGINIYQKGTTKGYQIGTKEIISKTDYCLNSRLVEFFCTADSEVNNAVKDCLMGCINGACLSTSASLTLISPNGGEVWEIGKTYEIKWQAEEIIEKVQIYLWFYDGQLCHLKTLPADRKKYSYTVDTTCGRKSITEGKYKILITGSGPGLPTDLGAPRAESQNYFTIVKTAQPSCADSDGGINYYVKGTVTENGKSYTDYCQGAFYLKEYFCLPYSILGLGGVAEEDVVCPNNGSCKDGACIPQLQPSITVLYPNGGEKWQFGEYYLVKWRISGKIKRVNIELENWEGEPAGGPSTLILGYDIPAVAPGDNDLKEENFSVKIPEDFIPSHYYRIRVVDAEDKSSYAQQVADSSDNYFSIVEPRPSITSIFPTSGTSNDMITIYGKNLVDTIPSGIAIEFLKDGRAEGAIGSQHIYVQPDGLSLKFQLIGLLVANITPGLYQIRAVNDRGESNTVNFSIE